MKERDLIRDLEKNIYCRLRASRLHGIGVFAVRNIPKGTDPFFEFHETRWVPIASKKILQNKKIPSEVKKIVKQFYFREKGIFYLPSRGLNEICISFFLNRSDAPNMRWEKRSESLVALRAIKKGEELTVDYRAYAE
jgi:SET domain-containing protein